MAGMGLPVPPGFTVSTEACRVFLDTGIVPTELNAQVDEHLAALEAAMGKPLGATDDPLLVSVRSGSKFSMPGMMETVLDVGLNDGSVIGLAKAADDERFAWDSYRRLIQMFGRTVLGIEGGHFDAAFDAVKKARGAVTDLDLDAADLQQVVVAYKGVVRTQAGREFPQHPREQPGHRGQRHGDGVRQPRPRLGLRGRLHPQPGHRRARRLRRLPAQCPG
jgi:pyruvate,orthophosphate dikinase